MASSSTRLLAADFASSHVKIRFIATGWRRFINGISNRYDDTYPDDLHNIITEDEFKRVMTSLHNRIVSHWPCDTCYIFGVSLAPCTLGASLLCPGHCAMLAEKESKKFLEDVTLSKKYYEKGISFTMQKTLCSSWVEIAIPITLFRDLPVLEDGNLTAREKKG